MNRIATERDRMPGKMFAASLVLHLLTMAVFAGVMPFRGELKISTPYYVDLVNLPSAEPAPGESAPPSPLPPDTATPAAPQAPPLQKSAAPPAKASPAMAMPTSKAPSAPHKSAAPAAESGAEQEAREFNERLSRMERSAEERHQAAALDRIRQRTAAATRPGAPAATGSSGGSDYGAYIQSRLKDAFAGTIVYRAKNPEASVHLYIDRTGRLLRVVMEKPSGDKLFNDSVLRCIEKARGTFPPPPNGADFDRLFVFSPQEINRK
jgi:colicin import membrane protein